MILTKLFEDNMKYINSKSKSVGGTDLDHIMADQILPIYYILEQSKSLCWSNARLRS